MVTVAADDNVVVVVVVATIFVTVSLPAPVNYFTSHCMLWFDANHFTSHCMLWFDANYFTSHCMLWFDANYFTSHCMLLFDTVAEDPAAELVDGYLKSTARKNRGEIVFYVYLGYISSLLILY